MKLLLSFLFLVTFILSTDSKVNDGGVILLPVAKEPDADTDGLPDRWEVEGHELLRRKVASPGHADLIVYIVWRPNLTETDVSSWVNRGVRFYGELNVNNPDGKKGINLIPIYGGPLPSSDDSEENNQVLRERHFPPGWRGIAHWHQFYRGEGGETTAATSSSSGSDGNWHNFVHELGHHFGLGHSAPGSLSSPMYASIMNYDYQFSMYDDPEGVQFSDGRFVSFPLNEEGLTEILPFPIKSLRFLEHGPYRYRLRANGASQTFIDWNWNGVLGEKRVRADINSLRELSAGPLDAPVERLVSHTALSLFTIGEELYLIRGVNATVPDSEAERVEINEYRRARLLLRRPRHPEEAEITLTSELVAGNPVAVSHGGRTYIGFPVEGGYVRLDEYPDRRFDRLSVRSRIFATPSLTKPSLVVVGDAVYLFLWNPAEYFGSTLLHPTEIKYRKLLEGGRTGPVRTLRETSEFDIGLAWDSIHHQLCLVRTRTANYPNRLELLRYNLAGEEFSLSGAELVGGVDGPNRTTSKAAVIFDTSAMPNGRLYLFYKGWTAESSQYDSIYCSRSIEDGTVNGGWQETHWWPTTGSNVAAVSFDGDIAIAYRTGHIGLAYRGTGVESGVMRDFNDLRQIREHGLKDSLEADRSR